VARRRFGARCKPKPAPGRCVSGRPTPTPTIPDTSVMCSSAMGSLVAVAEAVLNRRPAPLELMKHVLVQVLPRWSIDWQQAGPFYLAKDRSMPSAVPVMPWRWIQSANQRSAPRRRSRLRWVGMSAGVGAASNAHRALSRRRWCRQLCGSHSVHGHSVPGRWRCRAWQSLRDQMGHSPRAEGERTTRTVKYVYRRFRAGP
jgi:hypothetical protein